MKFKVHNEMAEMDAMLMEYAGEGIPLIAAAVGGMTFAPYFADFLPLLLNKTKSSCSTAEKSFAVGTLAESVVSLGETTVHFVAQLFPAFIAGTQDGDNEVCSNAVFGLGVLAEHGGAAMLKYPWLFKAVTVTADRGRGCGTKDQLSGRRSGTPGAAAAMAQLSMHGNQGKHRVTKRGPALSYPMFTLVTSEDIAGSVSHTPIQRCQRESQRPKKDLSNPLRENPQGPDARAVEWVNQTSYPSISMDLTPRLRLHSFARTVESVSQISDADSSFSMTSTPPKRAPTTALLVA
ncbi:unnamed protein product [Ranitomeya imitator]|uniref:Uncharacterized protein n=1 Tax=Ranitomeya imitator TaxID=111125 RepID=A0ABN9MFF2_9NEOB|nr:unnamed protein product [Ranitomeya imitator]